jgi:membrane associated rhomboid family serine protease
MAQTETLLTYLILLAMGFCTYQGLKNPRFTEKYLFSPFPILQRKEYYRMITSGFLHANWMHFGFNALTLYFFGRGLEVFYGWATLATIFLVSILGGSALSLLLHRHHDYRALGASGGTCGVVFAHIFLFPGGSIYLMLLPVPIPSWLYAILFLAASIYGLKNQTGNIGHDAHIGGAIIGLLVTTLLFPRQVLASPVLFVAVLLISATLFYYLWKKTLLLPSRRAFPRSPKRPKEANAPPLDPVEAKRVDELLDKIARQGLASLTAEERQFLARAARRRSRGP